MSAKRSSSGVPRWVKLSGGIAVVLALLAAGVHLAGGNVFGHTFGMHGAPAIMDHGQQQP